MNFRILQILLTSCKAKMWVFFHIWLKKLYFKKEQPGPGYYEINDFITKPKPKAITFWKINDEKLNSILKINENIIEDSSHKMSEESELDKFEKTRKIKKEERINQLLVSRKNIQKKDVGFGIKDKRFRNNHEGNNMITQLNASQSKCDKTSRKIQMLEKNEKVK